MSDSFTLLRSTFQALCAFPAEDMKKAFVMIGQYAMDDIDPDPEETVAYGLYCSVKPLLDRNKKKAEAGRIGGRSTQEHNASTVQANLKQNRSTTEAQPKQTEASPEQNEAKVKSKKIKDKTLSNDSIRFTPPTPQQVNDYAREKGISVDGERFCDFYLSKGWLVGKTKMKDWQAAVRNWARNDVKEKPKNKFANFDQRSYDFDELERALMGG